MRVVGQGVDGTAAFEKRRNVVLTIPGAVLFLAATAALSCVGYLRMFSVFAPWDDEGYDLISLKELHQGGTLYHDIHSFYGPLYYELMDSIFSGSGLPFTHDAGRAVSLALFLTISLICGLVVAAVAGSVDDGRVRLPVRARTLSANILFGCSVQLLVFQSFLFIMPFEPMHPGALQCLLLGGLVSTVLLIGTCPRLSVALHGALVAALVLVKVNVGVFALIASAVAWLFSVRSMPRQRLVRLAACLLFATTPFVLMMSQLDVDSVRRFFVVITASAGAVALALIAEDDGNGGLRLRSLLWAVGAAGAVVVLVTVAIVLRGTSIMEMLEWIVIRPSRWAGYISLPLQLQPHSRAIAAGALVLCVVSIIWRRRRGEVGHLVSATSAFIRIGGGVCLAFGAAGIYRDIPLGFGFAPLAWIAVLKPLALSDSRQLASLRRLLPPLAVLQTLQAYPVAGSQVQLGSFLLIPVGSICILDGWRQLKLESGWKSILGERWTRVVMYCAYTAGLAIVVVGAIFIPLREGRRVYAGAMRLPLPGSTRIRLSSDQVQTLTWVCRTIEQRCAAFVTVPGMNSFYLWTDQTPPTGFISTAMWWRWLTAEEQSQTVKRLQSLENLCVVRHPAMLSLWKGMYRVPGSKPATDPFMEYVTRDFILVDRRAGYEILMRSTASGGR